MSDSDSKSIKIEIKELSFKSEQHVTDLERFLSEALPQITLYRDGNEINVEMPITLSKRALKLRIKKFLYKKDLNKDFRPISFKTSEKEGYIVKERKTPELSYY